MKKLALNVEALRVESFATREMEAARGTVQARSTDHLRHCSDGTECTNAATFADAPFPLEIEPWLYLLGKIEFWRDSGVRVGSRRVRWDVRRPGRRGRGSTRFDEVGPGFNRDSRSRAGVVVADGRRGLPGRDAMSTLDAK